MSLGGRSIDDWLGVYDEVGPTYRALVDKLSSLLEELMDAEDVDYEWTSNWVLGRGHLEDRLYRAARAEEPIEDPFRDLPDFAAVTVIVSETSDIDAVADLVERELDVDHEASFSADEAERRRDDDSQDPPLGYEGVRYATQITSGRAQLTEWRPYAGLRAQVHVQTILEDAWERLDRNLPYYDGASYPPTARLDLGDFQGLIAAADRQYEQVLESLEDEHARYVELIERGELGVELNGESVVAYLQSAETIVRLTQIGVDAGLQPLSSPYEPSRLEVEQETLWLLRRADLQTLGELDAFLREAEGRAGEILRDLARMSTDGDFQPWALPDSIVQWLVLVLNRADSETIELMRYREEIAAALNTLIGNPVDQLDE
jgi:ppGpp synthetase/RelA/SpoT-type nucleotidyltranferase